MRFPKEPSVYILKGARHCCLGDLLYYFAEEDAYGYLGSRYIKQTLLDLACFEVMRRVLMGFLFHVDCIEVVNWYVFPKDAVALEYAKRYDFPSYIQFISL